MKLGPLDLNQPSTWRGLLGFAGVIGLTLKPDLRDQIAAVLAALLCLIEMLRDEYRYGLEYRLGAHFPQPAPSQSDFLDPSENPSRLSGPE